MHVHSHSLSRQPVDQDSVPKLVLQRHTLQWQPGLKDLGVQSMHAARCFQGRAARGLRSGAASRGPSAQQCSHLCTCRRLQASITQAAQQLRLPESILCKHACSHTPLHSPARALHANCTLHALSRAWPSTPPCASMCLPHANALLTSRTDPHSAACPSVSTASVRHDAPGSSSSIARTAVPSAPPRRARRRDAPDSPKRAARVVSAGACGPGPEARDAPAAARRPALSAAPRRPRGRARSTTLRAEFFHDEV
eukprot:361432-Chlamydomonas_euryale.AAC.13